MTQQEFDALVEQMKAGNRDATRQIVEFLLGPNANSVDHSRVKMVMTGKLEKFEGDPEPGKEPFETINLGDVIL